MSPATAASTRWCPTPEQLMILEEMYRGGVRTPSATQIQQITGHLSRYGKIEGKNVFYWFQNHKARDRQKLRRRLAKQLMLQQQQQQERGRDYCSSFREQHKNEQQQLVQQQQQQQQTYGFQQQPSSHLLQFPEPRCYDHHNYSVVAAASSGSTFGFQQYHICPCTKSTAAGCLPDQNGQSSTLNEMINCLKKVEIPGYIGTRNLQTDKAQKSTAADTAKNYGNRDRDNWPVITSMDVVGFTRPPKTLDLFPISTPSSTNVNYIR